MDDSYRVYEPDELGADGYPRVWHQTLKHDVREQAGDRCVRCLHPYPKGSGEWSFCDEQCQHSGPLRWRRAMEDDYEPAHLLGRPDPHIQAWYAQSVRPFVQAQWRILTVHHLNGVKADCRWWNLVALCQRCHLQIQGKVQMARVWPWEHSEWFRPYVAGYYASVYLGEELTRAEVTERLDELLALERVA
jgi:hypothetical protein